MVETFKNLRKFHNQIKLDYLNKYVSTPSNLLDLASGKGGDLHKWKANKNILKVVGYDINKESVKEAIKRRNKLKIKKRINFNVLDLSKNVLKCAEKYDVITSMFAFHYFFKSKETLDTILKTLQNCSKEGTIVILTLFNGDLLTDINDKNFYIKILNNDRRKKTGNQVEVYLKDSVLNKPEIEYIVKPATLINEMKKIKFNLIEFTSFKEFYSVSFKELNNEEKILSFLNSVYVFKSS